MKMIETKKHESVIYRIYDELKNHIGKENAISGASLSAMFDISERTLRTYIHEIRESKDLSKVILTCNKGYYIPTAEEGTKDVGRLFNQAISTLRVARATMDKAGLQGQYKIKFGEYYKEFVEAFGE